MSVIFSKSCEYTTQAILFIARQKANEPVQLRDISEALQIPHPFLNKVLQRVTGDGLLISHKGSKGGFTLGRPASSITLADIVRAVDGDGYMNDCVLGFPQCGDGTPCPVHNKWVKAKKSILDMMNSQNIDQLSKSLKGKLDLIEMLKLK